MKIHHAGAQDVHGGALARPAAKTALWVFLGVATSLFALFISAYAMRISLLDWTPLPQPRLLLLNTAVLVLASGAMQWAVMAARRRDVQATRTALLAGGMLGLAFVAGQLGVWKQLSTAGYFVATNAATGFFYLLTAVHAIHGLPLLRRLSRCRSPAGTELVRQISKSSRRHSWRYYSNWNVARSIGPQPPSPGSVPARY